MGKKLIVTIPAFNEAQSLEKVVSKIPKKIDGIEQIRILLQDDGSTDPTCQKAHELGVHYIHSNKINLGLARTFQRALLNALKQGADIIVNIDADGQYNAKEISKLVQLILNREADIVLGNRQVEKLTHMRWGNKYGNLFGSWVIRKLIGINIRDASTGFRAYSREAALRLNVMSSYTYTHETLLHAMDQGLVLEEVPVEFRAREGKSRLISNLRSHIMKAGLTIIHTFIVFKPLRVLLPLGMILFLFGSFWGLRFLMFVIQGESAGHIQSLILGTALMSIGFQIIVLSLIASAINWSRRLKESTLYYSKKADSQ